MFQVTGQVVWEAIKKKEKAIKSSQVTPERQYHLSLQMARPVSLQGAPLTPDTHTDVEVIENNGKRGGGKSGSGDKIFHKDAWEFGKRQGQWRPEILELGGLSLGLLEFL